VRIAYTPGVCSGLLCGLSILIAGCSNPASQTLDSLTVTATPSSLSVGGAAVLRATAHLSDGTTQDVSSGTQWTLSNPALASMSNGSLTAKATGTLTVQAAYIEVTPAGASSASATATPETLSASTQVTIAAAGTSNVPSLTWSTPAAVFYGTALSGTQLNATANVPGTFADAPAAGTLLSAGTQTLSVTFTPSDTKTYSAATASVQLNVNHASPVVTWATPAAISVGTALGPAQLNASANIPGSFLYNPAAGAVLAAGTQALAAVFTPTDTTDYATEVGLRNAQAQANAAGSMYNNTMHDNLVGWACWTTACGAEFLPASPADYLSNSVVAGKEITWQMEESEYLLWMNKTASAGIKVGPTF
jgi:hypothetical protein